MVQAEYNQLVAKSAQLALQLGSNDKAQAKTLVDGGVLSGVTNRLLAGSCHNATDFLRMSSNCQAAPDNEVHIAAVASRAFEADVKAKIDTL